MEKSVHFYNPQGEKLVGTLHLPKRPVGFGVVFAHCFTCSRHTRIIRQTCDELAAEGFLALRFDFSGNGQSEGEFAESTYSKQIVEMKIAAEFIGGKGARHIGLAGHSMGAVIAILTASSGMDSKAPKAVCALSGRLSGLNADHYFNPHQLKEFHNTGRVSFTSRGRSLALSTTFFADATQYDLTEAIQSFKIPLMIVHGDADEIVPVQEAYLAEKLNPKMTKLAVIPHADHMFSNDTHRAHTARLVATWFKEQYDGSP